MENIVGSLLTKFYGDATHLIKSTRGAENAIKNVSKVATKANEDLTKMSQGMFAHIAESKKEQDAMAQSIKESVAEFAKILKQFEELGIRTKKSAHELAYFATQEQVAEDATKNLTKNINFLAAQMWGLTIGLGRAGSALTKMFTLPILGVAAAGVKVFADWEQGTAQMRASMNLTEKQAEAMTDEFRGLALASPIAVEEFQKIAIAVNEAGVSFQNNVKYTMAAAKTAYSTKTSYDAIVKTLVAVSRAFGIVEENVERVNSVIVRMGEESGKGFDDFSDALIKLAPNVASLRMDFTELAAVLSVAMPLFDTGTEAATQLKTVFKKISFNAAKMAGQIGITEEAFRSMIDEDVIGALKRYVEGMRESLGEAKANAAIQELFGQRGADIIGVLIKEWDRYKGALEISTAAYEDGMEASRDFEITANTLTGQFKQFANVVKEVSYVIGRDLAPVVKKFLQMTINGMLTLAALWTALPKPIKAVIIGVGLLVAAIGPLLLAFKTLLSPVWGITMAFGRVLKVMGQGKGVMTALATTFTKLGAIITTVKTVGVAALATAFLKIIVIAGAVAIAIYGIYKVLDKIFHISDKVEGAKEKIKGSLVEIKNSFLGATSDIGEAVDGMAILATEWGDKIMTGLLYGFREADFDILNDAMRIVESYFDLLEERSEMTAQQVLVSTMESRRAIARAIYELKTLGVIAVETRKEIEEFVGPARTQAMIKEMIQALHVEDLAEGVNALKEELSDLNRAFKRATEIIDKSIKEAQKAYDAQIDAEEDRIYLLEKRKRENEKLYKEELRALEDEVDILEEQKNIAQDRLDNLKESNDLIIEGLQKQKDALQENVDETRKALDELRELRGDEVDAAEGMLDYAKMNLEAALNQLKKEEALGKDEWDASFRAAEAQVDAAQDQVDLAYANYLKMKLLYKKDEDILEDQLEAAEDFVDDKDKEIREARYLAEEQERLLEESLEIAQDHLDAAKDVLDDYKDAYGEQVDILNEEIQTHKDRVTDLREAKNEVVDALQAEKDTIEEAYGKEIDILEDRQDVAEEALENAKKLHSATQKLREEYLKYEQERLDALKDITGATEFPGEAAGGLTPEALNQAISDLGIPEPTEMAVPSIWEQWLSGISEKLEPAKKAINEFLTDIKELWGPAWENIKKVVSPFLTWLGNEVSERLQSILQTWTYSWGKVKEVFLGVWTIIKGIAKTAWEFLTGMFTVFLATLGGNWGRAWQEVVELFNGVWQGIKQIGAGILQTINAIFGGIFANIREIFNKIGEAISGLINWASSAWPSLGSGLAEAVNRIIGVFWQMAENVRNAFNAMKDWAVGNVHNLWAGLNDILYKISNGFYEMRNRINDALWSMIGWVRDRFNDMLDWIRGPIDRVWAAIQRLNPFYHGSPSLVENISRGVDEIRKSYGQLAKIANLNFGLATVGTTTGPIGGAEVTAGTQGAVAGIATTKAPAPAGGAGQQTTIHINPGVMIASKGEIRAFQRMLQQVQATEAQRISIEE